MLETIVKHTLLELSEQPFDVLVVTLCGEVYRTTITGAGTKATVEFEMPGLKSVQLVNFIRWQVSQKAIRTNMVSQLLAKWKVKDEKNKRKKAHLN